MWKRRMRLPVILGVITVATFSCWAEGDLTLRYNQPAYSWQMEALPVGNGRLGGMIFSGVDRERIQFNEDSLWARTCSQIASYQPFGDIYVYLYPRTYADTSSYSIETGDLRRAFDGNPETDWFVSSRGFPNARFPHTVVLRTPLGKPRVVTRYILTSAKPSAQKGKSSPATAKGAPKSWKLEGSNDEKNWVTLDRRRNQPPWKPLGESRTYRVDNDKAYRLYRLVFEKGFNGTYLQLAEISFPELDFSKQAYSEYQRELDLKTAVQRLRYKVDGVTYQRECFASYPDNVLVMRFSADREGSYTGRIDLRDAHGGLTTCGKDMLSFTGKVNEGLPGFERKYESLLRIKHKGGTVHAEGDSLLLDSVSEFTLILTAGTDFLRDSKRGWRGEDPHKRLLDVLNKASEMEYAELRERHIRDYQTLFNRVSLDLGKTPPAQAALPTDQRLTKYMQGAEDPQFESLVFQFARYLMISSSRPGCNPANLMGLWNDCKRPAWQGDYHPDVNIEMNYWFVDAANLSECFEPFYDWLDSIRDTRREETRKVLKVKSGWAFRSGTDLYGNSTWKWMKAAAAWCAQNLWDHYSFTLDKNYLESIYPILKELCEFWEETLKALPDGTLVAPDGWSPERGPRGDGISHEQQLVRDLFGNYIHAAKILNRDADFSRKIAEMRSRLLGPKIGKWGQLQEWMDDIDRKGDHHRHLSHLMALHPCNQISPLTTPALAEAVRVSLNARGDGGPGWSKAQKICLWARLYDGNRCHKLIRELLIPLKTSYLLMTGGGLFPNLISGAPVLVDANFGYAAGIIEMLLQSHMGELHLLPALPDDWPTGEVKGLKARGDFIVDIKWDAGRLEHARIVSRAGRICQLRADVPFTVKHKGRVINSGPDPKIRGFQLASLPTEVGGIYELDALSGSPATTESKRVKRTQQK